MKILHKGKRFMQIANAYCRLFAALIYVRVHKKLYQEKIWLITEKRDEARDNGYWLFRYVKEKHTDVTAYFVLKKNSTDIKKLRCWENCIVEPDSFMHCILYLAAEKNISSQNDGAYPFWKILRRKDLKFWKKLSNPQQAVFFLQHGVIQDGIPHESFDYGKNPMDCFVVSAEREKRFIVDNYGYPEFRVPNLGLCRFDNLFNNRSETEKIVLVMPTWRIWLQPQIQDHGIEDSKRFESSEYCRAFRELLTSKKLLTEMKRNGYQVLFYPHYEMQKYIEAFRYVENDVVRICPKEEYDVQDLLIRAKILITDYSSVAFDFAYLDKPLVYYQFDVERFSSDHFMKGYFDFKKDGFGPVFRELDAMIEYIAEKVDENSQNSMTYQTRGKVFFGRIDGMNSQRTFDYIRDFSNDGGL